MSLARRYCPRVRTTDDGVLLRQRVQGGSRWGRLYQQGLEVARKARGATNLIAQCLSQLQHWAKGKMLSKLVDMLCARNNGTVKTQIALRITLTCKMSLKSKVSLSSASLSWLRIARATKSG